MLVLLVATGLAEAKCAMPTAFLAGLDGSLPPDPAVWVFAPGWGQDSQVTVLVDGAAGRAKAELVSFGDGGQGWPGTLVQPDASGVLALDLPVVHDGERPVVPSFVAWRVDIDADAGSKVEVTLDGVKKTAMVEKLATLAMAPREEVALEDLGVSQRSWTCSFEMTRRMRPSVEAPVYRVEWAATEQAWKDGETHVTWMPRNPGRWFERFSDTSALPRELAFGHLNCAGWTLQRGGSVWVGVRGVFPDGSETPAPMPVRIDVPK